MASAVVQPDTNGPSNQYETNSIGSTDSHNRRISTDMLCSGNNVSSAVNIGNSNGNNGSNNGDLGCASIKSNSSHGGRSTSRLNKARKKKSRSGSDTPECDSDSSQTHSRSPSSCSSTNSGISSSNSQRSSSPATGGSADHSIRMRNLQSAVSLATNASNSSGGNSNPAVHAEDNRPLAICVRNLPARSSDTSLKDGLFHEYKKHGKVTWVKVVGQSTDRYAVVCFKKADDVEKALEVSHDKLFFGCKIEVAPYQGFDIDDSEFRPYEAEMDEYHPKSTRTLFIGNLEKDITSSELRKHFDCFGEIIEIDIKKQGNSAYAFCQYSDIVSVVKAIRKMDGEHLGNNRIKLGFGKSMPTTCVWLDGISDSVSETVLTSKFDQYGNVTQVLIDRGRKLGLVFFDQVQCAQMAVKDSRGVQLRGKKLQVDFASRECQEAFRSKLEKQGSPVDKTVTTPVLTVLGGNGGFDTIRFDATGTANSRYRYDSQNRSRASSFSRHNSQVDVIGTPNAGGTTPRGSGRSRGGGSSSRYYEYENAEYVSGSDRRCRNYDEYSQGSTASHEEDSTFTNYPHGTPADTPEIHRHRLRIGGADKSPGTYIFDFDKRRNQKINNIFIL